MNRVILMGRLTRDPNISYSQSGDNMAIARFTLAVDRRGRRQDGADQQTADFIGCVAFGRQAEFAERYKEEGIVWFLEACDLNVMSIRRALWQLSRAGWFSHVKGFLIGRPLCFGQEMMGLDQYRAVTEILKQYNVPVIMDADVGHFAPMMPLVCGSLAEISVEGNDITVKMG